MEDKTGRKYTWARRTLAFQLWCIVDPVKRMKKRKGWKLQTWDWNPNLAKIRWSVSSEKVSSRKTSCWADTAESHSPTAQLLDALLEKKVACTWKLIDPGGLGGKAFPITAPLGTKKLVFTLESEIGYGYFKLCLATRKERLF